MNISNFFSFRLDYSKILGIKSCHCNCNCFPGNRHYRDCSEHVKAMSDFGFPFDTYDLDMFSEKGPFLTKKVAKELMLILYHIC